MRHLQTGPLTRFRQGLDMFRTIDNDLPMGAMVVLLEVAARGPRVEVVDIAESLNMTASSLSRAIASLGEKHWQKNAKRQGLQLVTLEIHPEDRRKRLASLTPKGELFVSSLLAVVADKEE